MVWTNLQTMCGANRLRPRRLALVWKGEAHVEATVGSQGAVRLLRQGRRALSFPKKHSNTGELQQ